MTALENGLISCIIPVYNGARFIREALESVMAQTHPIHEILVVDDGSTDGTRAIVEAFAAQHAGRVNYLWQEHGGAPAARNLGIQAAVGEFVAFLDADDLWLPEKSACQWARFAARPELDICVTHIQNFWMDEVRDEAERMRNHPRAKPIAGYSFSTAMVRRSVFAQIGLLDATLRFSDASEWFMRAQAGKIMDELLPDLLVMRRMHLRNLTRVHTKETQVEFLHLLRRHTRTPKPAPEQPVPASAGISPGEME